MYSSICKPAEKDGVAVIHGSRGFFHSEKQPVFKAIYNAFDSVSCDFVVLLAKIMLKVYSVSNWRRYLQGLLPAT